MPLTVSFSVTQSLANPSDLTFTDTSTGSDASVNSRRIYLQLANGNWIDPNGDESTTETYITWAYASSSTTLSILSQSTAIDVTVKWMNSSTVLYTSQDEYCFNLYDYIFALEELQGATSNPGIMQDTTYYYNFLQFIVNIFNEENAITYGGDIYSSQEAMNRNQLMIENEAEYF